jgi:hypothetical protein
VQEPESPADDEKRRRPLDAEPGALAGEEAAMGVTPPGERAIALPLVAREFLVHVVEELHAPPSHAATSPADARFTPRATSSPSARESLGSLPNHSSFGSSLGTT